MANQPAHAAGRDAIRIEAPLTARDIERLVVVAGDLEYLSPSFLPTGYSPTQR